MRTGNLYNTIPGILIGPPYLISSKYQLAHTHCYVIENFHDKIIELHKSGIKEEVVFRIYGKKNEAVCSVKMNLYEWNTNDKYSMSYEILPANSNHILGAWKVDYNQQTDKKGVLKPSCFILRACVYVNDDNYETRLYLTLLNKPLTFEIATYNNKCSQNDFAIYEESVGIMGESKKKNLVLDKRTYTTKFDTTGVSANSHIDQYFSIATGFNLNLKTLSDELQKIKTNLDTILPEIVKKGTKYQFSDILTFDRAVRGVFSQLYRIASELRQANSLDTDESEYTDIINKTRTEIINKIKTRMVPVIDNLNASTYQSELLPDKIVDQMKLAFEEIPYDYSSMITLYGLYNTLRDTYGFNYPELNTALFSYDKSIGKKISDVHDKSTRVPNVRAATNELVKIYRASKSAVLTHSEYNYLDANLKYYIEFYLANFEAAASIALPNSS